MSSNSSNNLYLVILPILVVLSLIFVLKMIYLLKIYISFMKDLSNFVL